MYLRGPLEAPCNQISASEEFDSFMLRPFPQSVRPDGTSYRLSPLQTSHIHDVYKSVKQLVFQFQMKKLF